MEEEHDWEITAEGLYIATRGFLSRRGYCCANRCRNCPYINWRHQFAWQPVAPERVRRTSVSPKALVGASILLEHHEQELARGAITEQDYHRRMIKHYQFLLQQWR